ncbi:MAG TPA: LamG-like jellyroll fold domain-containing protein [Thermoanaerobaculia bacterium]|jgi:hypothetical protein|nr:LamG-like jellyroll fold domain-containing protein [Thermoanaerobaculia bacterium]
MPIKRFRLTLIAALLLASASWPAAACVTDPIVSSNADSGEGSLRDALRMACAGSRITFAGTLARPITVTLVNELVVEKSLTIQGPGAKLLILSGNHTARVLRVSGGSDIDVTISGLTVADGLAVTPGSRAPSSGGGILSETSGVLILSQCTISGNSASAFTQSSGGGITNSRGTLNIANCAFFGNSALGITSHDGLSGSSGGAIFNRGTMTVTNSTLVGNRTENPNGGGTGGAIANSAGATLNLINCTVFGNSVSSSNPRSDGGGGGGVWNDPLNRPPAKVTVSNTLIAGNIVPRGDPDPGQGPDVFGAYISGGFNLIGTTEASSGFTDGVKHDLVGRNPKLDTRGLRDNGGPTPTLALLAGSPAIDHGSARTDPATGHLITTDQRGFVRPINDPTMTDEPGGNGSDIGAYEYLSHQTACVAPPNTTMVAWYPFDEQTGTLSANLATGNNATQIGNPTPIPGEVAGALRFDGFGSYVESPSSIMTNIGPAGLASACSGSYSSCPGNFSIDAWIRVDPSGSDVLTILDKRIDTATAVKGYHFVVYQGTLGLQLADDLGGMGYSNYFSPVLNPSLTDGNWHHVAVTVRRAQHAGIRWYHNGVPVGIGDPTDRLGSLENDSPLRIGTRTAASPLTGWFAGDIDELEIFNRALTPQEVASLFNAGPSGKCK